MCYSVDEQVYKYIVDTVGSDYTSVIAGEKCEEIFYHLSDLRTGLLGWYDFPAEASVLEIDSGFGGLTGTICSRCREVTAVVENELQAEGLRKRYQEVSNLRIVIGWMTVAKSGMKFDYIVSVGHMEKVGSGGSEGRIYAEYLKDCLNLLKPNGTLLLAVENRYGLRYLCGEHSSYSELPFAEMGQSISKCHFFARGEIEALVQEVGVQYWKFYYALPDWRYPQVIYTDMHLPTGDVLERLVPYHRNYQNMLLDERSLYGDVLAGGGFKFLANSFLVECCRSNIKKEDVEYVALSTDRGRDKAFATVLYTEGKVKKQPLFLEGILHTERLLSQLEELKVSGLSIVPCDFQDGRLYMPYIRERTLSVYMAQIVKEKPDDALRCWDSLWQSILSSSSFVPTEENRLPSTGLTDVGPILQRAFLELMPMNCFYVNNKLIFFDQEYVEDNYPAKYVLFRGVYFFYILTPEAEKYLPLQSLKKRYGLVECWKEFEAEEWRFQQRVRRHSLYNRLYEHATPLDDMQLRKNLIALGRSLADRERELKFFLDHVKNENFVIFGAGGLFLDYMSRYGKNYPPNFVVDNDKGKWGQKIAGVKVRSPKALGRESCVLICSPAIKEITKQLATLGVEVYRIYC